MEDATPDTQQYASVPTDSGRMLVPRSSLGISTLVHHPSPGAIILTISWASTARFSQCALNRGGWLPLPLSGVIATRIRHRCQPEAVTITNCHAGRIPSSRARSAGFARHVRHVWRRNCHNPLNTEEHILLNRAPSPPRSSALVVLTLLVHGVPHQRSQNVAGSDTRRTENLSR